MNPWEVLGVRPGASADEVRSAYRRLARRSHPDAGGDPDAFRRIVEAHRLLTATGPLRGPGSTTVTVARRSGSVALATRWARRKWNRSHRPRVS